MILQHTRLPRWGIRSSIFVLLLVVVALTLCLADSTEKTDEDGHGCLVRAVATITEPAHEAHITQWPATFTAGVEGEASVQEGQSHRMTWYRHIVTRIGEFEDYYVPTATVVKTLAGDDRYFYSVIPSTAYPDYSSFGSCQASFIAWSKTHIGKGGSTANADATRLHLLYLNQ